jgi:hypothetical protein
VERSKQRQEVLHAPSGGLEVLGVDLNPDGTPALEQRRDHGRTAAYERIEDRLVEARGGLDDLPWFGMGRSVRAAHETCLVCTRGKPKRAAANIRSRFAAPVPVDANRKYIHSAKPPEFHELVETLCGDVGRVELFARRRRPGWVTYGLEVDGVPTSDQVYGRVATVG